LVVNQMLKICDFGISRKRKSLEQTHTMVTRVALSFVWSAPEQQKQKAVSPRNDCYSFGVILYWMIALNPGDVLADCAGKISDYDQIPGKLLQALDDGAARAGCPPVLLDLCRRCLSLDPKLRPADGREILEILDSSCSDNILVRGPMTTKSATTSMLTKSSASGTEKKDETEFISGGETSYVQQ
jgi:serine/threonine protein kinase